MDDRNLVASLLRLGAKAYANNPHEYATPADDPTLSAIGTATLANWLETLGGHRLIGDVQPYFSSNGSGFRYQATERTAEIADDDNMLTAFLDTLFPPQPEYDLFISYAAGDSAIANELRYDLQKEGLTCFMAQKDIEASAEWQDSIRDALCGSKRVLVLLTPRSIQRPWVLMETGAAWALGKPLIPALSQVDTNQLIDPIRRHQARVIETTKQRRDLIAELKRFR